MTVRIGQRYSLQCTVGRGADPEDLEPLLRKLKTAPRHLACKLSYRPALARGVPTCVDTTGAPRDWWLAYKRPGLFSSYLYADSSQPYLTVSPNSLASNTAGAAARTVLSSLAHSYVMYNSIPPTSKREAAAGVLRTGTGAVRVTSVFVVLLPSGLAVGSLGRRAGRGERRQRRVLYHAHSPQVAVGVVPRVRAAVRELHCIP